MIEPAANYFPLADEEHPHLIYEREHELPDLLQKANCYFTNNVSRLRSKRGLKFSEDKKSEMQNESSSQVEYHIETLIVLDQSFLQFHKSTDVENYVLTVFNMVSRILRKLGYTQCLYTMCVA